MRVLHVDSGTQMRGGQWQALYLMLGQKALGIEPVLLAPRASPLARTAAERGLAVQALSGWRLARLSGQFDIVHVHDARAHTLAALGARTRLVVSRRVAFAVRPTRLSRWKYRQAARYLAVSEFVARQLMAAGIAGERIAVVYDGVPLEAAAESVGEHFLTPAWDDPRKGLKLARESARLAGIELRVSRTWKQELASARAFLYLTEMEGLGSAALVAMAAGVPVIASRVGGLPEIVRHQVTGLLVRNEPSAVAQAIRTLAQDAELAARMGKQGRQLVEKQFTLEQMARRTLEEYEKVLG